MPGDAIASGFRRAGSEQGYSGRAGARRRRTGLRAALRLVAMKLQSFVGGQKQPKSTKFASLANRRANLPVKVWLNPSSLNNRLARETQVDFYNYYRRSASRRPFAYRMSQSA
jgi:hypothetical protein